MYLRGPWPLQGDIFILPEALPVYVLQIETLTPDQLGNGQHRPGSLRSGCGGVCVYHPENEEFSLQELPHKDFSGFYLYLVFLK